MQAVTDLFLLAASTQNAGGSVDVIHSEVRDLARHVAHRRVDAEPIEHVFDGGAEPLLFLAQFLRLVGLALGAHLLHHALDRGRQVIDEIRRLGQKVTNPGPQSLDQLGLVAETGHEDRRKIVPSDLQAAVELHAADRSRQTVIQHDQIDAAGLNLLQRLLGRGGGGHRVTAAFQLPALQAVDSRIILQDEHGAQVVRAHSFPMIGCLTTCKNKPSRRMASTNASYSTGLVI